MSTNKRVEGNTIPVLIVLGGLLFAGFAPANAANAPTLTSNVSNVHTVTALGGGEGELLFSVSSSVGVGADK